MASGRQGVVPRSAVMMVPNQKRLCLVAGAEANMRLLGLSVAERNARVAHQAGLPVVDWSDVRASGSDLRVLVVTDDILITPLLLESLRTHDGPLRLRFEAHETLVGWYGDVADLPSSLDQSAGADFIVRSEVAYDVSGPKERIAVSFEFLRHTGKPSDGVVSRHLNRPISRFFSYILLSARLRANHASWINLAIGAMCAWCAAQTGWASMVIAGVLFQFASIFDGVDGEMARVTHSESEAGAKMDNFVDNTTYVLCLIGVLIGWQREDAGPVGDVLVISILMALVALYVMLGWVKQNYAPDASMVFIDRCVARAAEKSEMVSMRIARHLFTLFRRDVFSLVFMVVSFLGLRVAIVALVAFGLIGALAIWAIFWDRLIRAAQELSVHSRPA